MANNNLRYNGDGQNYLVFLQFLLEEAAAKGLSEYFDVTIDIEPKKPVEKFSPFGPGTIPIPDKEANIYMDKMIKYRTNCRAAIALFKSTMCEKIKEYIRGISETKQEITREHLQVLISSVAKRFHQGTTINIEKVQKSVKEMPKIFNATQLSARIRSVNQVQEQLAAWSILDIHDTKYVDHRLKDSQLSLYLMNAMDNWNEMTLRIALVKDSTIKPTWVELCSNFELKASDIEAECSDGKVTSLDNQHYVSKATYQYETAAMGQEKRNQSSYDRQYEDNEAEESSMYTVNRVSGPRECFNCGKLGHMAHTCLAPMDRCSRCNTTFTSMSDTAFHYAKNCRVANAKWEKEKSGVTDQPLQTLKRSFEKEGAHMQSLKKSSGFQRKPIQVEMYSPKKGGMAVNTATGEWEYYAAVADINSNEINSNADDKAQL